MGAMQQTLIALAAASVGNLPLDPYTTGLIGAYGLQRLLTSYSTNALRIRRSSDNAEQDIGFTGNALDTTALAAFVGANDGFVVKWYDQSGAANDLMQATAGAQPQLVFAGVIMPDILTDGVDDKLVTSAASSVVTGSTFFFGGRIRGCAASSGQGYTYGRTDLAGPTVALSTGNVYTSNTAASSLIYQFTDPPTKPAQVSATWFDMSAGGDKIKLFLNGAAQTPTISGSAPANLGSFVTYLGSDGSGTSGFAKVAVRSFVMYGTALSTVDIGSISTALQPAPMPIDALQSYTANLWSATSHTRVHSGYAGSAMRVRRASDNAEQDIGFSAGRLDTTALASFCSGTNGFVVKRYDQSGGGNDWAQATAASQPKVYDSSTGYLGRDVFDGSNDIMSTVNNSGTPSAVTAYLRGRLNTLTIEVLLEHSSNYNTNDSMVSYFDSGTFTVGTHKVSAAGYSVSNFNEHLHDTVACLRSDRSQVTGATQSALLAGGRLVTRTSNGDTGSLPTGNMSAQPWFLGARSGPTLPTAVAINDVAVYETAHSDATANLVSYLLGG